MLNRGKFLFATVSGSIAVATLIGCNSSHLVNGATCNNGGTGVSSADTVDQQSVPDVPFARPNNVPVYHPIAQNASSPDAVPANAAQLLAAMDVTDATSNVSLSAVANQAAAFAGLGSLTPQVGSTFAWLSTGVAGAGTSKALDPTALSTQIGNDMGGAGCSGVSNSHDCAMLKFTVHAPATAHSLAFNFDFMSSEYPEFVGSDFNDSFVVSMSSPSNNFANIVYDNSNHPISINSVLFTQPCTGLTGTGFDLNGVGGCDAGGTGVLTTQAPVAPGEDITLTFEVYDMTDGIYDSAVMIDNFRFDAQPVATPNTGSPTPTPADSPTPTPTPACGA
ncbi:MAG TPA: choice-of-anchor L domain-containing protein [bacterium]|nr:choice-of-anchor L domain-containing protein [bacterium]